MNLTPSAIQLLAWGIIFTGAAFLIAGVGALAWEWYRLKRFDRKLDEYERHLEKHPRKFNN